MTARECMLSMFVAVVLVNATFLPAASGPAEENLKRISSATSDEDLAAALASVFKTATDQDLRRLISDPRPEIALAAGWERVRRTVPEKGDPGLPLDQIAVNRFLGLVEGRLQTPLPELWEMVVRAAHYNKRDNIWFPERDVNRKDIKDDTVVTLKQESGRFIATYKGHAWSLPGLRRGDMPDLIDSAAAVGVGTRTCIALYGQSPDGFTIYGVDDKSGAIVWKSEVWGCRLHSGSGPAGYQIVRLRRAGDNVVVFGVWGNAVYIEIFDGSTGKSVGRFGSWYFEIRP